MVAGHKTNYYNHDQGIYALLKKKWKTIRGTRYKPRVDQHHAGINDATVVNSGGCRLCCHDSFPLYYNKRMKKRLVVQRVYHSSINSTSIELLADISLSEGARLVHPWPLRAPTSTTPPPITRRTFPAVLRFLY